MNTSYTTSSPPTIRIAPYVDGESKEWKTNLLVRNGLKEVKFRLTSTVKNPRSALPVLKIELVKLTPCCEELPEISSEGWPIPTIRAMWCPNHGELPLDGDPRFVFLATEESALRAVDAACEDRLRLTLEKDLDLDLFAALLGVESLIGVLDNAQSFLASVRENTFQRKFGDKAYPFVFDWLSYEHQCRKHHTTAF